MMTINNLFRTITKKPYIQAMLGMMEWNEEEMEWRWEWNDNFIPFLCLQIEWNCYSLINFIPMLGNYK